MRVKIFQWSFFLTHFSSVLHFIYKPVICFEGQNKWLVSIWNAKLSWSGLIRYALIEHHPCFRKIIFLSTSEYPFPDNVISTAFKVTRGFSLKKMSLIKLQFPVYYIFEKFSTMHCLALCPYSHTLLPLTSISRLRAPKSLKW